MHTPAFRRFFQCSAFATAVAIAGVTSPSAVAAQAPANDQATTTRVDDDDDGPDLGWLGLLGLAGLFGLRRRDDRPHHTDTPPRR
jgi:MYXO-CTERM domain-containing protein